VDLILNYHLVKQQSVILTIRMVTCAALLQGGVEKHRPTVTVLIALTIQINIRSLTSLLVKTPGKIPPHMTVLQVEQLMEIQIEIGVEDHVHIQKEHNKADHILHIH